MRPDLSERGDGAVHYVLSDIHGNERRFNAVMEQIDLQPEDTLYVLGDAIDRNFEKWGYTFEEKYGLLQPAERNLSSYAEALDQLRSYIHVRGEWLDVNIDCLLQYSSESRNKKHNESRR